MNMVTLPLELRNAVAERLSENSCSCSLPVALSLTLPLHAIRSTGRSIFLIRELARALSKSLGDKIIALPAALSAGRFALGFVTRVV